MTNKRIIVDFGRNDGHDVAQNGLENRGENGWKLGAQVTRFSRNKGDEFLAQNQCFPEEAEVKKGENDKEK